MNESKNTTLNALKLLKILERYTDETFPKKREELLQYYEDDFGEAISISSFDRYIKALGDLEYEIEHLKSKGYYLLDRPFEEYQLQALIGSVLCNPYISASEAKELIEKLKNFASINFYSIDKYVEIGDKQRGDNAEYFLNIEEINKAIRDNCQITYSYCRYNASKELQKAAEFTISPYSMIARGHRFYVVGYSEKHGNMVYHKLDRIKDIQVLEDEPRRSLYRIPGYDLGSIDTEYLLKSLPYMFTDTPENIILTADASVVDDIIDWFGKGQNVLISPNKKDKDKVTVAIKTSPMAMRHWAKQYATHVTVDSPESLRKQIAEDLAAGLKRYGEKAS